MRINPNAVFLVLFTTALGATIGYALNTTVFASLVGVTVGLGVVCLASVRHG